MLSSFLMGKDIAEHKLASKQAQLDTALKHFEKALDLFKHINHLQGKLLAARHILACLSDDQNRNAMRIKIQKQVT